MHSERNKTERKSDVNVDVEKPRYVLYGVEDVPSPPVCFLFGLQQAIMCIGGTLSLPYLIPGLICAEGNYELTSKLMSITLFMCGVATILQTLFGIRLGIVQGGSNLFLLPIIAMMASDKWKCPNIDDDSLNSTDTGADREELWESRMREIQGNLIVASITQVVLGCTGVLGILLRFVGPLTIAPTITMIGPLLVSILIQLCNQHWGIAFLSMGLTLLFSAYLANINPPFPAWTMQRRFHIVKFPLFQLFSVILSLGVGWFFCFILTASDVFPNNSTDPNYLVRTDAKLDAVERAPWLYFPYPFQFGTPTVSSVGYVGFLVVTLVSVLESVCDYHAAARMTGAPPPPPHAVNRGIAMEGIASIVSGMVGAGHGTTSYSHNIGAIGITKVIVYT
ncbi:solute carrier family 23 member 2-like [Mercenaria mercenaria]|uniref:solute carrier family 23 member 2-like n=1 Tax=Mercenaria mercenaria TaxID=6596 RepID=UPI00234F3404|nr:solute carrier family 23 member 2-like [Mercenaria mercenaria]